MAKIVTPAPARLRVMTIDGGGIYGLATAIWLRRLCEKEPHFLTGDDICLFAGTSAGALNCLLLAKHEEPRRAVLDGVLEKFWEHPGTFANNNPIEAMLGLMGVRGWFSDIDFMALLRETFGGTRLGDLPHQVLISTYNWTGRGKVPTSRAAQGTQHWRPKFFNNACSDDSDCEMLVADIAYAAAAPPTLRAIFNGYGDGGTFSGNPVLPALAHVKHTHRIQRDGLEHLRLEVATNLAEANRSVPEFAAHGVLDRVAVISIGSGQRLPRLVHNDGNVNMGLMFQYMPTDPSGGDFWPTSAYSVDAASEEAEYITKELLGAARALRLNPAVLAVPAVTAAMLARNPYARQMLLREIRRNAEGEASTYAILGTLDFLRSPQSWDASRITDYSNWTPQRELSDRCTAAGPALASMGEDLFMAWMDPDPEPEGNLWVSTTEAFDTVWSGQQQVFFHPPRSTHRGPAAAWVSKQEEGTVVLAFCSPPDPAQVEGSAPILMSLSEGNRWSEPVPAVDSGSGKALESTSGVSLATKDGVLVLAWQRANGAIGVARGTLSGAALGWTWGEAPAGRPDGAPAIASGPAGFVMAFSDPDGKAIWIATSPDGARWSELKQIIAFGGEVSADEPTPGISGGPALAFLGGRWFMAWQGRHEHNLWVSVSATDQSTGAWLQPVQLRDRATRDRPALAQVRSCHPGEPARLLMAWRGLHEDNIWVASLLLPPATYDGSPAVP